ncbi:unnamed protein product [Linum tenue]|uniref:Uncharacterized protein n=1 Tax=Linum tenue TaxID=586396 RepID=A0AAV0NHC9_9ROSI|nr:unnamed protein product [Linum tenue]
MASSVPLLGPPEAYRKSQSAVDGTTSPVESKLENLNLNGGGGRGGGGGGGRGGSCGGRSGKSTRPRFGRTENGSITYKSAGNPCLEFFFHVVPSTPREWVVKRLRKAWRFDPLTTLKLICNLRGVRGTGKSNKEKFYTAALWLYEKHPITLARNARVIADFGYFKDLLEILYRLLEGSDVRDIARSQWQSKKRSYGKGDVRKAYFLAKKAAKEEARAKRKEKVVSKATKAFLRYLSDSDFRLLHDSIAQMFADALKQDLENLSARQFRNISLAAKWCPSLDSSYDKATLICESIARRVFPKESDPEYEKIEDAHYAYRVRDRLRKQVLVPLRRAIKLPEVYMSARQWRNLPYDRVPSVAMKNYKGHFVKHDGKRFNKYLEDVAQGKVKIAAGALLPHEIIADLKSSSDGGKVAELQWARMVEDMAKIGKLNDCIAVCDVSGSMFGEPMEVCVALGLLISELSEEPWKGKVITFHQDPRLNVVEGKSLLEKTEFIRKMDWGGSTDFQKVFDRILEAAVENGASEEQMVRKVFVFSDMEFNMRPVEGWETDYEAIQRKFKEKGFSRVPEIVFWNLRDSSATPVKATQSGVALVSGYSKNLVKLFMEEGAIADPVSIMHKAIEGELYQRLVVCD